jgi:hypothetical protein
VSTIIIITPPPKQQNQEQLLQDIETLRAAGHQVDVVHTDKKNK